MHAYDSVMCGYFCIELINFMLKSKSLTDFTNLFALNFKDNNKIILKYMNIEWSVWCISNLHSQTCTLNRIN